MEPPPCRPARVSKRLSRGAEVSCLSWEGAPTLSWGPPWGSSARGRLSGPCPEPAVGCAFRWSLLGFGRGPGVSWPILEMEFSSDGVHRSPCLRRREPGLFEWAEPFCLSPESRLLGPIEGTPLWWGWGWGLWLNDRVWAKELVLLRNQGTLRERPKSPHGSGTSLANFPGFPCKVRPEEWCHAGVDRSVAFV